MNSPTTGNAKIIGVIVMLIVGAAAMIAYRLVAPQIKDQQQADSSDAAGTKGTIKVGIDSWVGYIPLCSKIMRQEMRAKGYLWVCEDDQGNYKDRFSNLSKGQIQLAVSTIDALLVNGAAYDDPGVIIAVLDESKGGDALVADKAKYKNLDQVKKSTEKLRIAFTPASPSEYFLTAVGVHFDIPKFLKQGESKRIEVEGAEQAFKKLKNKDADIAVLWEPFVSMAMASGDHAVLLSTRDSAQVIVDVLLAKRTFAQQNPSLIQDILSAYFHTLKQFRNDSQSLHQEVAAQSKLQADMVGPVLKGVNWFTLMQNARDWFGLIAQPNGKKTEGLADAIESTAKILLESRFLPKNPIPGGDPFRLQNKSYLEALYQSGVGVTLTSLGDEQSGLTNSLTRPFTDLDAQGWSQLIEVGSLKVRPIAFQSGTGELGDESRAELDAAAQHLAHYPNFRILVKGHTGVSGEPEANRQLSEARAQSVVDYLVTQHQISRSRLRPVGLGGTNPLPRQLDESDRAFNYRLPRVEISLVSEMY